LLYKKVMLVLNVINMGLLYAVLYGLGIFNELEHIELPLIIKRIVNNNYFSGVLCSIIAVFLIYFWQVWYSKRKLKQDFRCNECIEGIFQGIASFSDYCKEIPYDDEIKYGQNIHDNNLENAKKRVDFYNKHKGEIDCTNISLSHEGNDLLIESVQSCFFINLNFELLGIVNDIKNRLPNLRTNYPEIKVLYKRYKETESDEVLEQLGWRLNIYFVDVRFMAMYWQRLLDYLKCDPTYIQTFIKTYNSEYKIEDDIKLPMDVRIKRIKEVEKRVIKAMRKDKIKNIFK